jgi:hypothetical protein
MVLWIIVYLVGVVLGYISFKKWMIGGGCAWSVANRWMGLFLSLFSWVTVFAGVILIYLETCADKPAKW